MMSICEGQIWRKDGPCDWVKIIKVLIPGHPQHDGGAPGCSVVFSNMNGNWERRGWFILAKDDADFEARMKRDCRYLQE